MKALTTLLLFSITFSLYAKTTLPIVKHFEKATDSSVWKDTKKYHIPAALIGDVEIKDPSMAFRSPYNNIFLQNEHLIVCYKECDQEQNVTIAGNGEDFIVKLKTIGKRGKRKKGKINQAIIRQNSAYYWITKLFERMSNLGYNFKRRLIVKMDRDVSSPTSGAHSENNAFFNPADWTLSFLPAHSSWLSKKTLLPSGSDPSVAIHETGHFIFAELTENKTVLNAEIGGGYNEGFADYMAMTILNTPTIGTVMMGGKAIRTADATDIYEAGMEVHALGNVFTSVLWRIRDLFENKDVADKIIIEATKNAAGTLYSQAADYVESYFQAFNLLAQEEVAKQPELGNKIKKIWVEFGFVKNEYAVNVEAIKGPINSNNFLSASFTMKAPAEVVQQYGLESLSNVEITMVDTREGAEEKLKWHLISIDTYKGGMFSTPLWIYVDYEKDAVLAAYDINGVAVNSDELQLIKALGEINSGAGQLISFMKDYGETFRHIALNKKKVESSWMWKSKKKKITNTNLNINGKILPAKEYKAKIRRTFVATVLSGLFKRKMAELKAFKQIKIYTVKSELLPENNLPIYTNGETFVGYEILFKTGVSSKVIVSAFN